MTSDVVTIDGAADLRDARRVFAKHAIRCLPVVSDGKVIAIVTVDDLFFTLVNDLADITRPRDGRGPLRASRAWPPDQGLRARTA